MAIFSLLATYALSGVIGFLLARKIKTKPSTLSWGLLALLAIISPWILPGTRVIAIEEFHVRASWMLQGISVGVLLGLLSKRKSVPKQDVVPI